MYNVIKYDHNNNHNHDNHFYNEQKLNKKKGGRAGEINNITVSTVHITAQVAVKLRIHF